MLQLQSFAQLKTVATVNKSSLVAWLNATPHRHEFAKCWLLDQDAASMLSNNNLDFSSKFKFIYAIYGRYRLVLEGTHFIKFFIQKFHLQ